MLTKSMKYELPALFSKGRDLNQAPAIPIEAGQFNLPPILAWKPEADVNKYGNC
jgi:hypothetical protein